jgi:outer membrane protein
MNWIKSISFFLSFVLLFSGLRAQENLSAEQAVFNALKNNFDILISEKQEEITGKNNTWSEAGLFPTVSLQIGQNNSIQDNSNNPFSFTKGVILSQGLSPSLVANVNLFSGFQVKISKQRLEQLEEQSKGNTAVVVEALIQDVMKTYYSALLQKERRDLFENLMKYSSKRLRYSEIKNQYSANNSLELLQLKNQFLTDSTNFLLQTLFYENSLRNLVLLMNNSSDSTFSTLPILTDKLDFLLSEINPNEVQKALMENNQNLKNQFLALELQKTNIDFQRSFLYPTVSLNLNVTPNYGQFRQLSGGDPNAPDKLQTQSLAYGGNFTLRYNIYNNWKAKRAVEVAKIQTAIGTINIEKLKNSLQMNLTNQLNLFQIRKNLVNVSSENIEYATKAYDLAQKRFDTGTVNSIDLLVFQTNYQNTLLQHYENLYNRLDTYLEIYRLSGNIALVYGEK